MTRRAPFLALLSAAMFGVSTPAAKALLGSIDPIVLAGLLYCGAGAGVAALRRSGLVGGRSAADAPETPLVRADLPWLAGAIVAGGILGPLLLMVGLSHTDAASASLLLTLEGVATALLAWLAFHEHFDRRIAVGMASLVAGAAVLAWSGRPSLEGLAGPAAIVGACIAWGLDNNLTRKVSLADPLQIVEMKGLVAGPVNLAIGLWAGGDLPAPAPIALAGAVGFLGYGISLALFVHALRHLGTARTGAYFSTAPFLGAVTSVVMLGEPIKVQLALAGVLMAVGVWLHLTERHEHEHEHLPVEHAHAHVHDEHHHHDHALSDSAGEPHAHKHSHGWVRHAHPHMPDMHHVHRH
ncbi:DMT family transporter [Rhodopseudomonas pseudopalustris]|uniref:DMT family transporter n=1 Tax=Rhodopseudomonas pseudopalustris TaxID=1513892 RepID=UPI003F9CE93F